MNRKYALFGFLPPVTALVFISAAVYTHEFSFTKDALSDLGRIGLEKNYLFNAGLILSGLFGFVFSLSLYSVLKGIERIFGFVFVVAAASLVCIGVFPAGTMPHGFFSVAFYLLSAVAIFLLGVFLVKRKRNLGIFSTVTMAVGSMLALIPGWEGVAIPETIGAFFICLWIVVVSHNIITHRL